MAIVQRILLVLCTLTWWVLPGMGVIDLSVTWDPDWPVMLEAGWGLFFTVGLGLPFLVTAVSLRQGRASLVQVYVVAATLLIGVVAGVEPQSYWIFVLLAIELPLLHVVARGSALGGIAPSPVLAVLVGMATPPAVVYAWEMAADNRRTLVTSDITNDTDHFAVQAALAIALVALPAAATMWPTTRRLLGTSSAMMAAYLGLVSLAWPNATAGFSPGWSIAAMAWAGAVLLASWLPISTTREPSQPSGAAARP